MRILVCVKQVPDGDARLDEAFALVREGVPLRANPADECALEAALCLRDAARASCQAAVEVVAVAMGLRGAEGMLRELLARGLDGAALLNDPAFAGADTLATATTLAAAARRLGGFDLIFCGRRAIDAETGQTPPMLAAFLERPIVTNARRARLCGGEILVERLGDAGEEELACPLPAVVAFCEWSHALRPPSILGLRNAAKAEIPLYSRAALALDADACGKRGSPTAVVRLEAGKTARRACRRLTAAELLKSGVLRP